MGRVYDGIDVRLREFVEAQSVFFVATAPLSADGYVNLSPKGVDGTLAVLDEHTVDVHRVSDSCGYGVPLVDGLHEGDLLIPSLERKPSLVDYRIEKNRTSIDGLPAFDADPVAP